MKTKVFSIDAKEKGSIDLPRFFESKIREDIVIRVLEIKKKKQPYSPDPLAGMKQSAKGKMRHRRHIWQTHYGRGMSRIPRKVMSRRGTQFNWVGAEVPFARGGKRAHPPKVISMAGGGEINKKEMNIALESAFAATANPKIIKKKYPTLKEMPRHAPFVIESKASSLNSKQLIELFRKILGEELFKIAIKRKSIRAGIGKLRGRRYKKNAGMLLVKGSEEKFKTNAFEIKNAKDIGVVDLSRGGLGRLTAYTEDSIKELGARAK